MADLTTTYATCWKITLQDGNSPETIKGYTDFNKDLTISGQIYISAVGYVPSAFNQTADMSVDNMEVMGILNSSELKEQDLLAGLYDFAKVEIFTVDWTNEAGGIVQRLVTGRLGSVTIKDGQYRAELFGLSQQLQKVIGELYSPGCQADLGDSRCGIDLTVSGSPSRIKNFTVTGVTDKRQFADNAQTDASGYFDGGKVTWVTGDNAGYTMDVKKYLFGSPNGTIELHEPMPFTIQISNTGTITQGCDKSATTCKDDFDNLDNFRGFPHIPGQQKLLEGPA